MFVFFSTNSIFPFFFLFFSLSTSWNWNITVCPKKKHPLNLITLYSLNQYLRPVKCCYSTSADGFPLFQLLLLLQIIVQHRSVSLSLDIYLIFVYPNSGGIMTTKRILLLSDLGELCCFLASPTEGETQLWNHVAGPPLSHRQMFSQLPACLAVTSSPKLFVCVCVCVQQARWCGTPVSFQLSRCFTWYTYQNIETLMKTTVYHVGICQGMITEFPDIFMLW